MFFRIKLAFWGVLIGSLLSSSTGFSQVVQGSSSPPPWQNPGPAQAGVISSPEPAVITNQGPPASLPYYPSMPYPTTGPAPAQPAVSTAAPSVVGQPSYGQLTPTQATELSPIEQYVSGKIPQTLTFDIKQFGYDLFFSSQAPAPSQGSPGQSVVPQGGTPQGYAAPGVIPPGSVSPSGVSQGVPSQALPPQGGVPQAAPYQGYIPQGAVSPTVPAQGTMPQGAVPQGSTSQGIPPQIYAPQSMPGQGTVPQGGIPQAPITPGPPAPSGPAPTMPSSRSVALGTPSSNVPVGPDYVIGPGDEVRIAVWGSIEGSWNTEVDRDGNVNVPKIGTIGVTGLSFQELKNVLQKELSKYFKDFQMNVTMGTLRTMTVYVVGNAQSPGAYSVSSLSTIINALVVAGGPSKAGTMRDIQLKRKGEIVGHLDLYDFLISGDKTRDLRLLPEDVIFIPPIGPIVGVAGNVDRPAIYEMKGRVMLSEGIKMAGGVTAAAHLQRVQVERVFQRQTKIIVDVNFEKFKGKQDIPLQGGDIVKIFPIVPLVTNKVVLQGNVRRPGEYEWRPGMRARDVLPHGDSLLPDTFLDYALITRLVPPDNHQEYRSIDLGAVLFRGNDQNNIPLEPYDVVTVFNKWEMVPKEKVRITGAVNKPGEFDFRPNMKLSDLLKLAGGVNKYAYRSQAELTRVTPMSSGPLTQQLVINPEEALAGNPEEDVSLQGDDYIFVKTVPDWHLYRTVSISGEVRFQGNYALTKGERLSSVLERAGGFTDKAYPRGAVLTRFSLRNAQQQQLSDMIARLQQELMATSAAAVAGATDPDDAKVAVAETKQKQAFLDGLKQIKATGRMVINVEEARRIKSGALDVEMEDGDMLTIPTNPQTVQVIGSVYNQANFVFIPTKDYSYYIDRAGGFNRAADKSQVYIVKVDGSTITPGSGLFWNTSANQWETGSPGLVEAGDTIVVPAQLERIAWLRNIKDLSQILYQATLGGAVVWKLFQ
jgi:protein involved in polysaccharide export with SLBB domain